MVRVTKIFATKPNFFLLCELLTCSVHHLTLYTHVTFWRVQ